MLALALVLALAAAPTRASDGPALPTVEATFDHDLASPTGVVRLTWPALTYDRANREIFVAGEGFVRIFDANGMEIHRFGDDGSLGQITRVAVLDDGQLVVGATVDGHRTFWRCDFRGDPIAPLTLTGLPKEFADFEPDQVVFRNGRLYFAERGGMRVVMADTSGAFRQAFQLRRLVAAALAVDAETRGIASMEAFNVDMNGNLLFTMATLFAGAVVSPSGEVRLFGSRGSRPGTFNIIGGIDADELGNVYVSDRLRSVVSVWDRQLRHLGDFGYRGSAPENLLAPYEIAVGNGRVYVTQAGNKGVKVFRVELVDPPPPPDPDAPRPLGTARAD